MHVLYDEGRDVLYACHDEAVINNSKECPNDVELVLHYDKDEQVIGFILIGLESPLRQGSSS